MQAGVRAKLRAVESWLLTAAPWLLAVSLIADVVVTADPVRSTAIDFHVYRAAAPNLLTGHLYDYRWGNPGDLFPLPFLYPPFAALPFLAFAQLPWTVALWIWHAISVASVWWLVRSGFRVLVQDRGLAWDRTWQRRALLTTAAVLWIEPVRLTLAYGQINLVLAAVLLAGMLRASSVAAGASVGITAGTKLTPAISGLYFLATRRYAAAAWAIVVFFATVALGFLTSPGQSLRYWWSQAHDAGQQVPIGTVMNQSLRGALSRTVGFDVGGGALWLAAAVAVLALSALALWGTVRAGDRLAGVVVVQFLGLQLSPISWNHHWVWMVPALCWLVFGGWAAQRWLLIARLGIAAVWLAVTGGWIVMAVLLPTQPDLWSFHHPGYVTFLAWAYPVCGVLTTAVIAASRRQNRDRSPEPVAPAAELVAS